MANRTTKQFSIQLGGTPQPLVGTWVTATVSPSATDSAGFTLTSIPVNDSSMFNPGDWAYLVDAALTAAKHERVWIQSVPDSTHIKVKGLQQTRLGGVFGTGDFVALSIAVNSAYVQSKPGNTGNLFIGTEGMNKTGLIKVIAQLIPFGAAVQPVDYSDTRYVANNATDAADLWIDGTSADGYQPSFGVV